MMTGVKRGRITAEEKTEIERLAITMKSPTPGKIAMRLNRHPATIAWFMIRHGMIERQIRYGRTPRNCRGILSFPYTPEQDARLLELRRENRPDREIADALTSEFGIKRNAHSVYVRAIILACYVGGEP